jgi:LCP family protein required for cell wall assembly
MDMLDSIQAPPKYIPKSERSKNKKKWIVLFLILIILALPAFYALKTGIAFSKIITIKNIAWEKIFGSKFPSSEYTPEKDPDRINALILGIRGEGDPNGGLLTDGIMMVSYKKSTGQVVLFSIPRDLYLQMPGEAKYEKVNAAYALGLEKYNNGLDYVKKTVAYITGQYLEYALVVNFEAFKDLIDLTGGVEIHLDQRFVEDKQWWCDKSGENCRPFVVEAGDQILDGETALYYVRSRFSTNDFDRARRQQQVLLSLKDKLISLGVLADPLKISGILDVISKNIKTDVTPWEIPQLIEIAKNAKTDKIITKVFENSPEGLLYQTQINGIYVLLPTEGNFSKIREACKNIFSI